MTHEIQFEATYICVTDGFGMMHGPLENNTNQQTTTGLALMVCNEDEDTLIDIMFSEYYYDSEENLIKTQRPIGWSVGYTEEDAQEVADLVFSIDDNIFINPIKHPDREEWAVPFHEVVFNNLPDSPEKLVLAHKAQQSIANGNRKNIEEMIQDGWKD